MSTPDRRRNQHQRRPTAIGELSERALDNLYDENKPLKHYLKIAERYRKDARDYYSKGDLENAFIFFARAATLVLDKLPTHREFYTLLNATQRSNLNLNGTDILEDLGELKRKLTKRYEEWFREHPDDEDFIPSASTATNTPPHDPDASLRYTRSKGKERDRGRHGHQRRIQEDYSLWRQDDYDIDDVDELAERERKRNRERDSYRDRGVFVTPQPSPRAQEAKKEAAVAAAREAAFVSQTTPGPDYTFSRPPLRSQNGQTNVVRSTPRPDNNEQGRRYMESERQYQYEQQQKEMRHREEEILRKREQETRRRGEEEGIVRRQKESEDAARAARYDPRVLEDTGSRAGALAAQSSIASIASASTVASSAPSTLFQRRSPGSTVTTPASSFYPGSAPTSFYAPIPGSSSAQVMVAAPPSNPNPGSSLTTVMYTNSRNPSAIPPSHAVMSNPEPIIPSQVPPQPRQMTPPQATQQVPQQVSRRPPLPRAPSHEPPPQPIPSPQHMGAPQHDPPSVSFQESTRPPSFVEGGPTILPIEPARLDGDTTDSESIYNTNPRRDENQHSNIAYLQSGGRPELHRTPTRNKIRSPSPVTTTSPPPPEAGRAVMSYPQLMSQHQKNQGYYPSTNSMFAPPQAPPPRSRDHVAGGFYSNASEILHHQQRYQGFSLYPHLPSQQPSPASSSSSSSQPRVSYPGHPQSVMSVALPTPPVYSSVPSGQSVHGLLPTPPSSARSHHSSSSRQGRGLKTVTLPKEVLPRFLAIAKVNTAMNRETCGLLLGKDKGSKFAVTTLLIPKQYSTSDTCTMDEEELVLQFTEERSLITLGWIHTHPSQSCFMSSLDLHTHSGFQRMLPESFAVVCAPKSTPNYGIFRLTDPPGLKIILDCKEKEAFHPHPDSPIYTDADKGHVQIKDGAQLEIVDLR